MKAQNKKVVVGMEKLLQETFIKNTQYRDSGGRREEKIKDDASLTCTIIVLPVVLEILIIRVQRHMRK